MIGGATPPSRFEEWLATLPPVDSSLEQYILYNVPTAGLPNLILRTKPDVQVLYNVHGAGGGSNWFVDPVDGIVKKSNYQVQDTFVLEAAQVMGLTGWTAGGWNTGIMNTALIKAAFVAP